jgi:hypothetical protein
MRFLLFLLAFIGSVSAYAADEVMMTTPSPQASPQTTGTEVGSSGDVALSAETGTPSIDGFGMEGAGAHGVDDYVDFATLAPRAYLMARLLMDAGRDPPKR